MTSGNVCSVMVLYYPEVEVYENVIRVLGEVDHVFLIDNTDSYDGVSWLLNLDKKKNITLIRNRENKGIACALNIGLKQATFLGYEFSLLMDQDTLLLPGAVESLASIYHNAEKEMKVCMVGSTHYDGDLKIVNKEGYKVVKAVITSGTLMCLEVYQKLGMFDEKYFIDQVDHEYCLRALNVGYVNIISTNKLMEHTIGEPSIFSLAGFNIQLTNHSALRRYYFTRNKVFLLKEYFFKQPAFTLLGLVNIIKIILFIGLFESDKKAKLCCIFSGFKDGLLSISGKRKLEL